MAFKLRFSGKGHCADSSFFFDGKVLSYDLATSEGGTLAVFPAVRLAPTTLGPVTKGKTCIGCQVRGLDFDGKPKTVYIYNLCDHQACYKEVKSQAISYTTGVPAMIGAKMMLTGKWRGKGVFNMEQFDPDPFMEALNQYGLPWKVIEGEVFHRD